MLFNPASSLHTWPWHFLLPGYTTQVLYPWYSPSCGCSSLYAHGQAPTHNCRAQPQTPSRVLLQSEIPFLHVPWALPLTISQDGEVKVAQSCLTLRDPVDCSPRGSSGVGSLSFLQEIFTIQGLNPSLLHCRQILYHLSHQESPTCPVIG